VVYSSVIALLAAVSEFSVPPTDNNVAYRKHDVFLEKDIHVEAEIRRCGSQSWVEIVSANGNAWKL